MTSPADLSSRVERALRNEGIVDAHDLRSVIRELWDIIGDDGCQPAWDRMLGKAPPDDALVSEIDLSRTELEHVYRVVALARERIIEQNEYLVRLRKAFDTSSSDEEKRLADRAKKYRDDWERAEHRIAELERQRVPREPTPAMCVAGFIVSEAEHDPGGVWIAMYDAALTEKEKK